MSQECKNDFLLSSNNGLLFPWCFYTPKPLLSSTFQFDTIVHPQSFLLKYHIFFSKFKRNMKDAFLIGISDIFSLLFFDKKVILLISCFNNFHQLLFLKMFYTFFALHHINLFNNYILWFNGLCQLQFFI